jgi:hypothetical protein
MTIPHAEQREAAACRPMRSALVVTQMKLSLFVRRASQQWVVQDPDGNFWLLPSVENPWDERQPFFPTEENELEPVPGHYKYMLGLPFN